MKRAYWEKTAPSYNEEIFDVLKNDRKNLIRKAIKKYSSKSKTAIDAGCAIGKWLPVLSPLFRKVYAVDISQKNLDIARQLHAGLTNIEYLRADMSRKNTGLPVGDFGICINAILTPSLKERELFFAALGSCIRKGGYWIITVPSLESYLLTQVVQQQWKIDRSFFPEEKNGKEAIRKWNNLKKGNADIDDVPHKHFLKEELQHLLPHYGFSVTDIQKIEYEWSTEFHRPPEWLQQPGPWDWMIVTRKN